MSFLFGSSSTAAAPLFPLEDKVVIVTGASAGIGQTLVETLATQKKAKVVLAARRADALEQVVASSLKLDHDSYLTVVTDVTKEEDCKNLMEQTIAKFGRIDVLVCNAGITQTKRFQEMENLDRCRDIMNTNYFGTLHCVYYALPHLVKSGSNGGGMIVAVSSMLGKLGVPTRTGYCASKHAIHGLLDSLRTELVVDQQQQQDGNGNEQPSVHILIACPGYVKTSIREVTNQEGKDEINETSGDDLMSAQECVDMIVEAMEQKRREVLVVSSYLAKLAPLLRFFAPAYIDQVAIQKQKGGRT